MIFLLSIQWTARLTRITSSSFTGPREQLVLDCRSEDRLH